jgi:hypothetical protein
MAAAVQSSLYNNPTIFVYLNRTGIAGGSNS